MKHLKPQLNEHENMQNSKQIILGSNDRIYDQINQELNSREIYQDLHIHRSPSRTLGQMQK